MLKAIFVMAKLDYIEEFLCQNDIPSEICNCDEFEIRIELESLKEKQIKLLKKKFNIKKIKKYDYLIFWG